ncbi:hypothetical protein K432DRAFT_377033 [Lepidopterella palustris CBS 459.81]|uniref:Uncharacterized protein n=1 Tax=Lepidopterella palustris CBS 459.81 TaxID=1314670 RepID=A0A8E2ELP2_9PEZI|nr:hypothetical protein K432DRAFT_377033 [Lepidopterella palustris CBS 459.81]
MSPAMSPHPPHPSYEIGYTHSSERNTDVELNVHVGDKHIQLELLTANFEASPALLEEYLLHVKHSDPEYLPPFLENPEDFDDDDDEFADLLGEFYESAMKPLLPLFHEIPPLDPDRLYTLQDCLYPERQMYTLQVAGDEFVSVPLDPTKGARRTGVELPASAKLDDFAFPVYRPDEIHLRLADNAVALPPQPRKVYIKGKGQDVCFFKQLLAGDVSMTVTETFYVRKDSCRRA